MNMENFKRARQLDLKITMMRRGLDTFAKANDEYIGDLIGVLSDASPDASDDQAKPTQAWIQMITDVRGAILRYYVERIAVMTKEFEQL